MQRFKTIISIVLSMVLLISALDVSLTAYADDDFPLWDKYVYYLGDVDKSGDVTAFDARLALIFASGNKTPSEEERYYADYNGDGKVTAIDARMILKTAAGEYPSISPAEKEKQEERKQKWIASFSDEVSYNELERNLKWLVNDIGIRNWWDSSQNEAGDLIYKRMISYGYTSSTCKKIDFTHNEVVGRNVMATIPTSKSDSDIILVVAHYDTVKVTAGAVDNSSGTSTLLQLAKIFKETQDDYGVELRFLFTAGEEQGYYGAKNYVETLSEKEKARHKIVFNVDMTAKPSKSYDSEGKYCIAISTEPLTTKYYTSPETKPNIGTQAVDKAKESLGNLGEYAYYSAVRAGVHDIVPFRNAGMEAVTFSWRVIDSSRSKDSDYSLATPELIHTEEDTIKNCDITSLYNSTRLIINAVARLITPYIQQF